MLVVELTGILRDCFPTMLARSAGLSEAANEAGFPG